MALRNIVKIDENKCNGCGACVNACAEGAIQMIDGKAKLVSEIYCDGLGACLDCCPVDAITIEQRDAAEFDEEATKKYLEELARNKAAHQQQQATAKPMGGGCPGAKMINFAAAPKTDTPASGDVSSQLAQWPVQLKLVSPMAPYFAGADLMLVADCVPFAMGDFHEKLLKGKAIAVACPKLDDTGAYAQKIADIITTGKPKSLTVVHMEVPCCTGLLRIAEKAVALAGSDLKINDITVSLRGEVLSPQ
ncbi:MAG: ATP-binding protein [Planctomycetota bacterium]|jgi:NAD-dependent dihydropyrimidine dehydrogenase PreA subunit